MRNRMAALLAVLVLVSIFACIVPRAFSQLLGDINDDGVVDVHDYQLMKTAIPSMPSSPNWIANADLDSNGVVDGRDLVMLKRIIATTPPP